MEYFLINIFIASIFIFLSLGKDNNEKKIIYYLIGFYFILFLGLRGSNDEYSQIYYQIPTLSLFFSDLFIALEKGPVFALVASFFRSLDLNSQSILFFFAFTSILIRLKYFYKFSEHYILAFLFYLSHEVIFHEYWQIRQGLSSAMILPMIYYLINNNKKMFFIFYIISSLIHYAGLSAIILLLINKQYKIKTLFFLLIIAFFMNFIQLSEIMLIYLSNLGLLPAVVQNYIGWDVHYYSIGLTHPKTLQQIITSFLILFFLNKNKIYESRKINYLIINTYILSTIFQVVFNDQAVFATRLGGHFYIVEPIVITYFIGIIKERNLAISFAVMLCIAISFINYIIRPELQPYKFLVE